MISGWEHFFNEEQNKGYFKLLITAVKLEYENNQVYPNKRDVFKAYQLCSIEKCKVVLVGQDPYHGYGQANGLCFSVSLDVENPPSLCNIFKELKSDLGIDRVNSDLSDWASQGVLLLNRVLSVKKGVAYSHQDIGWQQLTLATITFLNQHKQSLVFVLWGKKAQELIPYINQNKHHIVQSSHPSPLSAYNGFFGSKPFSKVNSYLSNTGQSTIKFG